MDHAMATLWNPGDLRYVLRAALDRIIPADDFPGAVDAGVERSLIRQLTGDARKHASLITSGLHALDAEAHERFGASFAALDAARQDEVLAAAEAGAVQTAWSIPPAAFFNALLDLTNEGYYADAGEADPREMVGWRMIGYRPGPRPMREAE